MAVIKGAEEVCDKIIKDPQTANKFYKEIYLSEKVIVLYMSHWYKSCTMAISNYKSRKDLNDTPRKNVKDFLTENQIRALYVDIDNNTVKKEVAIPMDVCTPSIVAYFKRNEVGKVYLPEATRYTSPHELLKMIKKWYKL